MIATTSSGRRFASLARYLVHGRAGSATERVAWTASRNLGTDDPTLAASLMQATAAQSVRVESPVYHLTISFDRADPVDRALMERVADRLLQDLGLAEHQAVLVAHQDRAHPHVHLMVNRIHPDTGVAWERWQDRPRIERTLREAERALGLREVPGRLHQLDGQAPPERALLTNGERRQAERSGEMAYPERVQVHVAEYRAARSWEELAERLTAHGFRLERKGQGLVITDGERQVKASRIGRDLSLQRLEARFGTPYPEREVGTELVSRPREPVSPAVADLAGALREHERVATLERDRYRLTEARDAARHQVQQLEWAVQRVTGATAQFREALGRVYREPERAHRQFQETAATRGAAEALRQLAAEPERFGPLHTVERRRAWGLLIETDDTPARGAARGAAALGRTATEADRTLVERVQAYVRGTEERFDRALAVVYREPGQVRQTFEHLCATSGVEATIQRLTERPQELGALLPTEAGRESAAACATAREVAERARDVIGARAAGTAALITAHATEMIARTEERRRTLAEALAHAPGRRLLERSIATAVSRLEPRELAQLHRLVTRPQAALAFKLAEGLREIALGREEPER